MTHRLYIYDEAASLIRANLLRSGPTKFGIASLGEKNITSLPVRISRGGVSNIVNYTAKSEYSFLIGATLS